jgi:hypothetical protein
MNRARKCGGAKQGYDHPDVEDLEEIRLDVQQVGHLVSWRFDEAAVNVELGRQN